MNAVLKKRQAINRLSANDKSKYLNLQIYLYGLVRYCRISSALAVELLQSYT